MNSRSWLRLLVIAALLTLLIPLAVTASADGDDDQFTPPEKTELKYPNLGSMLNQLVARVEDGEASAEDAAEEAPVHREASVAVTIYLSGNVDDVVAFLEDNGGSLGNVGQDFIEAYVPVPLLGQTSEQPGVLRVRAIIPPEDDYGDFTSQGVQAHLAEAWHEAGYSGQGVKVGVIDGNFDFRGFSDLMGTELPTTVETRCYTDVDQPPTANLADCEGDDPDEDTHGTAVAEAVIDIAPEASLYIASPLSRAQANDAVDWMVSQGVSVIVRSEGSGFDGPGDGTSPDPLSPLKTVDRAVDGGIIWVNSAGNQARRTWFLRGPYSDPDGDKYINFSPSDEGITMSLEDGDRVRVRLRWDDSWGGASRDFDLFLRPTGSVEDVEKSVIRQAGGDSDVPYEWMVYTVPSGSGGNYAIFVVHESGSVPDWIQLSVSGDVGSIQHYTENGSITNPGESANPGMLAVGAAHYYDTNTIANYSSRGPTPDGRKKPDIVGAACGESATYPAYLRDGQRCWFSGTSQAAPHVAGLAALVKQRFPNYTPEQVADYLKDNAEARGTVPNNTWGHGFAQLPPTDPCGETVSGDGPISGEWASGCDSQARGRGHARFYGITLAQQSEVTVTLESGDADTYLYLREGDARSGAVYCAECENDDHQGTNSQIRQTLAAGTYTIEATTFNAGETGSFTLTLSGLGTTTTPEPTPPEPTPTDPCGETVSGDGDISGEWASGCDSQTPGRGHARFYGITLAQQSDVTVTLESGDADTYLYLREDDARSGAVYCAECENDDHQGTNSQIQQTLAAGTYTIEATTFNAGETGSFTLTLSGLGTTTTPEPTPPEPTPTDPCGETVSGDGDISGEWASGCDSQTPGRGHARFYGITLAQQSDVTVALESGDADTYLYLREDDARSGAVYCAECENDDHQGTNSQIQQTLAAGTYTIEATTFNAGETGSFTLTLSGLGIAAMPTQSCSVGQTLASGDRCSHQDFSIEVDSSGTVIMRFTGNRVELNNLSLVRDGNSWTIGSLP